MATKDQTMEVHKQEETPADELERTRSRRSFVPRADIYATDKEITVLADIPGANEKTVDITLEKHLLSISAYVEQAIPSGFDIAYAEYEEDPNSLRSRQGSRQGSGPGSRRPDTCTDRRPSRPVGVPARTGYGVIFGSAGTVTTSSSA